MKLETLEEDADWLFRRLNLTRLRSDWDILREEGRTHGGDGGAPSQDWAAQYFSQISRENMTRLYEKYQVDFQMFGYEGQVQHYVDLGF